MLTNMHAIVIFYFFIKAAPALALADGFTGFVDAGSAGAAAVPFVSSFRLSTRAQALSAPVEVV